jgi:catechol 2,3-dioxygenase-like lactoylglutathione lyase family enzyme
MDIRRTVPIVNSDDLGATSRFYSEFLGFEVAMEETGFTMFRSPSNPTAQVIAGSSSSVMLGSPTAQMTVEVSDVDAAYAEAQRRELRIVYPITDEPWGIRRFFVEDPDGNVINVAMHRNP